MKGLTQLRRLVVVAGVALLALGGASATQAEAADTNYTVYVSAPGTGKVAGVAYGDEDVLRFAPAATTQWSMHFDGSAAGLPAAADIDAYAYAYNANTFTSWHYMSFDRPVNVPGLGKVDDSDVVLYRASLLGNDWFLHLDGSEIELTTDGEDIDAIALHPSGSGNLLISTSGNYELVGSQNLLFTGSDEDQMLWIKDLNDIVVSYTGTLFGIPAGNDLHNVDFEMFTGGYSFYFGLHKAGNVNGVAAAANDVVHYKYHGGVGQWYDLFWDASASGFPKIDAFEVVLK